MNKKRAHSEKPDGDHHFSYPINEKRAAIANVEQEKLSENSNATIVTENKKGSKKRKGSAQGDKRYSTRNSPNKTS